MLPEFLHDRAAICTQISSTDDRTTRVDQKKIRKTYASRTTRGGSEPWNPKDPVSGTETVDSPTDYRVKIFGGCEKEAAGSKIQGTQGRR